MTKSYLLIVVAILAIAVAAGADFLNFKKNGGHNGNSIVESAHEVAQNTAKAWILRSAPTYVYDGSNIQLIGSTEGECPKCFVTSFSFESSHGGYGDRDGLFVTQVITPHIIAITVNNGKITEAITDGKYNELTGALAE